MQNEMPVKWEKNGEISSENEFKFYDATIPAGQYDIVDERYYDPKKGEYYTKFVHLENKNAEKDENSRVVLRLIEDRKEQQ